MNSLVSRLILLNIDGLRSDVLAASLADGTAPHLCSLVRPHYFSEPLVSAAPSTTFTCQGSMLIGAHPRRHGIVGNQFFDRLGGRSSGRAKHIGLDVGDALSYDDAVAVFSGKEGLADRLMPAEVPTLFDAVGRWGWTSAAVHFMYGRGATIWERPSLIDLARFKKGKGVLGLSPAAFDRRMVQRFRRVVQRMGVPNLSLLYFMGLDTTSHREGPSAQRGYLETVIDPLVGEIVQILSRHEAVTRTVFLIMSDHGQISVTADERHALRIGNLFTKGHESFAAALRGSGGRLHQFLTNEERSDVVFAPNGGLAHLYIRRQNGPWSTPALFTDHILPAAQRLIGCSGSDGEPLIEPESLAAVLVRDTEREGWDAPYQAIVPSGEIVPLERFFADPAFVGYREPASRLNQLASAASGDIVLLANGERGFYFGGAYRGQHGGLLRGESECSFALGAPSLSREEWTSLEAALAASLHDQRRGDERDYNTLADIAPVLMSLVEDATRRVRPHTVKCAGSTSSLS